MLLSLTVRKSFLLQLLTYGVALHGLLMVATTLEEEFVVRLGHGLHIHPENVAFSIPLILGMTLMYVSLYLRRRKWTAWLSAIVVYAAIFLLGLVRLVLLHSNGFLVLEDLIKAVLLPGIFLVGLVAYSKDFTVRSDLRSFAFSLRFIALVMSVTFVYGVSGMLLLDRHDLHREISVATAVHQTIDQFGLTTDDLSPHTRRARIFLDSLSVVSTASVAYGLVSLFQPLRARLTNQAANRTRAKSLLEQYGGGSEDFFKLWPHDKFFYFNQRQDAGLAYGVHRGVALVAGDPFGNPKSYSRLLGGFDEFCKVNDWQPAFIHTSPAFHDLYKSNDYGMQKIGEEAIVHLDHFDAHVKDSKYFRQIRNKFAKQGYATEFLLPPHSRLVTERLRDISNEWLRQPGRVERRFLVGYYSDAYIRDCPLMVLKDKAGVIQAFINQVPSYDAKEANFDILRHAQASPSNSNDFLLMGFMEYLKLQGFKRLNMGLCPLSGIADQDEERTVIDSALSFMYANGDRFYSFGGFKRFKGKYQPEWSSRYIAYRGGFRTFGRVIAALNKAMKMHHSK